MSEFKPKMPQNDNKPGFWVTLFRTGAVVQVVWAVVIGVVAVTAIIVYGGK